MKDYLALKWGTIKRWDLKTEKSREAAQKYFDFGMSMSAMCQDDSPEQKKALIELIDAIDGEIENDWTGQKMSKEEAKEYVLNYR